MLPVGVGLAFDPGGSQSLRGDLLRSWVSDGLSVLHPEYVWHRYARRWQDAATGTADIEAALSMTIEDRAAPYEAWGLSRTQAHELAGWFDETMGRTILEFYPSVAHVNDEWGPDVGKIDVPGMALAASKDPFVRPELAHTFGRPPAIHVQPLEGVGHWWMLEEPERSARVLEDVWASLI
jgi:pimeloyl-ACP methyl ester carboxylesterase